VAGSAAERRGPRAQVDAYLAELAGRAREVLGERLVGVYAGGSLALGAYEHGRSDLDVAVVVEGRLEPSVKDELVAAWRHEALPCPARGLELVVYSRAAAAAPATDVDFELNLNTGRQMTFRADFEFDPAVGGHWFPIDRAILGQHALAIVGPPAREVFGEIPREALVPVVAESLRWHEESEPWGDNSVLNAARALRWARTGEWSSKPAAGRWALTAGWDPPLVTAALAARGGAAAVDPARAAAFVANVLAELRRYY
jgi:Domain of unknown function (DUF4111)/Nucleotidyltransferase domain